MSTRPRRSRPDAPRLRACAARGGARPQLPRFWRPRTAPVPS